MLWYLWPGLLLHLRPPRPTERGCLFSAAWLGPSPGLCRVGGAAASPGGAKLLRGDGRKMGGMLVALITLLFSPSASLSFDCSSFSPCPVSSWTVAGSLALPTDFGDHLPRRVPSIVPQTSRGTDAWLSEPGWASAGRERECPPPLPREGTHAGTPALGGTVPPFPIHVRVEPRRKGSISV